jgi:dienelactone hydrolase
MAEILLFHHALGLTPGVQSFADTLRANGHVVHVPDLFEGATFPTVEDGVAHAEQIGFDTVVARGRKVAEELPAALVYAGFSLGVMPAQLLAQTRPGARAALLLHGAVPPSEFGTWPDGVPVQMHTMEDDDWGDVDVAREIAATVDGAELFVYPGDRHLFTDAGLSDHHDEAAAAQVMLRVLGFLERVDRRP